MASENNNNKNSKLYFIILIIIIGIILNIICVIMPIHSIIISAKTMIWLYFISILLITNLLFIEFYFRVNKEQEEKHNKQLKLNKQKQHNKIQIIFQSQEFNDLDSNQLLNKYKNENIFNELSNLKEIQNDLVMEGCKLEKNQLDARGNRNEWDEGENRGGKPYNPPNGWNGIGLRVLDKYENNAWLGSNNSPDEWCVAYHGVGFGQSSDKVKEIIRLIYSTSFKAGWRQKHQDCADICHYPNKVGAGVYCTPSIITAEEYAGISEVNGKKFKTVLMVRVKPNAIRMCQCEDAKDYWVVNGTTDEIRPYRILFKPC